MKKSIKYAGIAAATLLTVAPIAAPVLTNATTVQAVTGDGSSDDEVVKPDTPESIYTTAKNKFTKQFSDMDAVKTAGTYTKLTLGEKNAEATTAFNADNKAVINSPLNDDDVTTYLTDVLDKKNVKAYLVAEAGGKTYNGDPNRDAAALDAAIATNDDSQFPVKFTLYMKDTDINGVGNSYKAVANFNLNKSDEGTELKSINAKFTTPLNVAKKSKTSLTQLSSGTNVSLADQNGDAVSTTGTSVGKGFFRTYATAIDAAKAGTVDAPVTLGDDIKDGEFKTAGTYYQVLTYKAGTDTDLANFINNYNDDPSSYTVYVNGKAAAAGYDFATSTDATTISFVRAINVSDSEATWTTENVDGQVTTKNDASYYTLKNNDNNTITNRALQANTAWKTDKVRTDQDGNKQYRVATGEWVNANDVTFTKAGETPAGDGLTDIQKVTGQVSLDGGNYVYFLYGKDGKLLTQRSLMPGTDWKVINTAKDAEGNTYYRVATNEWLQQGTGVHFN
ncbi:SLAP domain-containing protein [Companilactobacillus nodensis]|uniref:Surface layer protein A domain-containing protein n=1 Tax=Companilactobacillus nodensis DSM 19682 = JCM 14932 = NBRC 107160 TaxID=1423775 RepID=A0A0R1K6U1_9LACO|nr:SLAP domain-containing protein [Companilactobacillus nodensis]KRK78984.1 hypothetical protein FD03_GL001344 [Companilactobacillus nodensis DSM 19682 = JCM 14932 = NBRC 107160]